MNIEIFNTRNDVTPFSNGAFYHVAQPPIFANGILSDYMVGQITAEAQVNVMNYCRTHPGVTRALNHLLFDQANRNLDVMAFNNAFIGSGLIHQAPPKKGLMYLDAGGCGKTTTAELIKSSFHPKYVLHLSEFF